MNKKTSRNFKILFVDDEEMNVFNFKLIFQDSYEIITALSGEEGLHLFAENSDVGLIVSDQRMPGISGTEMLSKMYEMDPDSVRVLLTAHSQIEDVMNAINRGHIYQYILKPWNNSEMEGLIERAKDLYQLKKENISLTNELADKNKYLEQNNAKLLGLNRALKRDVARRQKLEASLKESEERFRKFTQASQDIILLFDENGKGIYTNPAVETLLGFKNDDFINKPLLSRLHPDDREAVKEATSRLLSSRYPPHTCEVQIEKKNHDYLDVEMNIFAIQLVSDQRIVGSIIRDITQRKISQQQLALSEERLSDLSAMLITAQDNERRRLAMELHDEFSQSLAALKMQLRALENDVYRSDDCYKDLIVEGLRELRQFVNQQIDYVRNLSQELWPMIVDDLGVDVAFDNLIGGFLGSSSIELDIKVESVGRFFPVEKQRHLYRLLQESLNNVVKHADATRIQIQAGQVGDTVVLAVHDNGCGFNVEAISRSTGKARGMGLQSMDERAKLMDGTMKINSRPGMGASIIFTLAKDERIDDRV